MDSRLKKLAWFGVATLIVAVLAYVADLDKFLSALQSADLRFFAVALVFGVSIFTVWSFVWYSFFTRMEIDASFYKTYRMFMSGQFLNFITPVGQFGGEPLMAYIISRNTESSYEKAFSTVLSADIINAIPAFTFILGGAVYLVFFGSLNQMIVQTIYLAILTVIVGGITVYALWFKAGAIESFVLWMLENITSLIGRGEHLVEKAEERLDKVQDAFETVGENPRHLLKVAIVGHAGFLLQIGSLYFVLLSLGIYSDFVPLYFVIVLSALGNYSPTPGGSGTMEGLIAGLLTVFVGISFSTALVAAILFRMTIYWPGLLIGYLSLTSIEKGAIE